MTITVKIGMLPMTNYVK